jgi:cell division protein DivIC
MQITDKRLRHYGNILYGYYRKFVRNKFVAAFAVFLIWMLFFDNDNIIHQLQRKYQIIKLNKEIKYYQRVLEETKIEEKALNQNDQYFEKFVREKYLLKRDDEDLFIFSEE